MSNVLKSKVLLGAMIVLAAVVGVMFIATTANAYTHSVTLKMGSTGSQVMELQKALNAAGYAVSSSGAGSPGMESTYFGAKTHGAVVAYQTAKGLGKDGIVGPMTGASLASVVDNDNDNDNDNNDNSDLQGGAGSVDAFDLTSGYSNEEVGEDAEDVEVAGLEIENGDGSDIEITAVKLVFDEGTAGSDFEDYASEVSVWFAGEEVARVDADDFNDNNNWTKTVSLDGAVLDSEDTEDLIVAISGINNLDSSDASDTWDVDFRSVRYVDAQNASTTEDPGTSEVTFSFESFASAADTELKITEGDEEVNDTRVINVDATDDTDDVELLSFAMEAEGDSDVVIDSLPVTVTTTETTGNDPDDLMSTLYLYADGEEIGSESLSSADADDSSEVVVFDDLDYTISAGDEIEFTVKAKLLSIADVLDEGDTIAVAFGETQTDLATFDAEDESGEDLADGNKTGTVTGEAHVLNDVGFTFSSFAASEVISQAADPATAGSDTTGTFTISFKVAAFDGNVNIDKTCVEDGDGTTADQGISYVVSDSGNNASTCSFSSTANTATGDSDAWTVLQGDEETFTLTVAVTGSADTFAKVYLEHINWESDTTTPDTSPDLFFTAGLGEDDTSSDTLFLNTI